MRRARARVRVHVPRRCARASRDADDASCVSRASGDTSAGIDILPLVREVHCRKITLRTSRTGTLDLIFFS